MDSRASTSTDLSEINQILDMDSGVIETQSRIYENHFSDKCDENSFLSSAMTINNEFDHSYEHYCDSSRFDSETRNSLLENSMKNNYNYVSENCNDTNLFDDDDEDDGDDFIISEKVFSSSEDEFSFSDSEGNKDVSSDITNIVNELETPNNERKRKSEETKNLTRKRVCNPQTWKKNIQKMSVNLGKEYTASFSKKDVPARSMQRTCGPGCKFKCETKISEEARNMFFTDFWSISEHSKKYDFIVRHVSENLIKENDETSKKNFSRTYKINNRGKNIVVCKTMFLNTLNISQQMIKTAFNKLRSEEPSLIDKRGKSKKPRSDEEAKIESVVEHVKMFPKVESHYLRKDSSREYLEENLTLSKMYQMYVPWAIENNKPIATKHRYYDVFNTKFNISFFKPKKDQCDLCEGYKNAAEKEKLEEKYKAHIDNKEMSRKAKEVDKNVAKEDKSSCMIVFDFEKILITPKTEASCVYYMRKLSVYNFTIYDIVCHEAYCYIWSENDAKKGSNEVASCLLHFIEKKVSSGIKNFFLWSDNCPGQNRNRHVFSMYVYGSAKYNIHIKHSFLETGHTQNEGDSVHATIERHAKGQKIFTCSEWCDIIRSAKLSKPQYQVINVTFEMIFDFHDLSKQMNWTQTVQKKNKQTTVSVPIAKLKQVMTTNENQNQLQYKTSFNLDFEILVTRKEKQHVNVKKYILKHAYKSCLGLPAAKLKDLKTLCHKNIIPQKYHSYYESFEQRNICENQDSNEKE